ncbi:MAG: LutB/LldF family L-lactate oxidation iron-sulfur protein [Candidatus Acidiferrales bacterium]
MTTTAKEFLRSAAVKSADIAHRQTIRKNIDSYDVAVARGRARFQNWQAAREKCQAIKRDAIDHLDRYLEQFEASVKQRGGQVFWAENGEQARQHIIDLAAKHNVRTISKSKSMVAEEIHLAPALEEKGIAVFETDLGEFIVQLRKEPPYHIVTPAMHLTRVQIAKLFKEKLGGIDTDDPEQLVAAARVALRRAFFSAEMGITGANFLVADQGLVAITTNEGNADLGVTLPRINVVIAGIEKVIPRLQDLALFWPVLAGSGTGQPMTVYNTLVGGPRSSTECAGPEEFHVILLDNGRTDLLADPEQREVLHCIRCGACLNACPVYRNIGGHTYNTTYPGPIGSVLTPHLRGLDQFQHLSYASSLCGACTEVCPVKIDLHHHLLENRRNAVNGAERPAAERLAFKMWRWTMGGAGRFAFLGAIGKFALRAFYGMGAEGSPIDPLKPWTKYRAAPPLPAKSFRALWKETRANE